MNTKDLDVKAPRATSNELVTEELEAVSGGVFYQTSRGYVVGTPGAYLVVKGLDAWLVKS